MSATRATSRLDEAREALKVSVSDMQEWDSRVQALPEDADEKEVEFNRKAFEAAAAANHRWQETVDRLSAIERAQADAAARLDDEPAEEERSGRRQDRGSIRITREEKIYTRASASRGVSFFRDLLNATHGDVDASDRLSRYNRELAVERRDLTTVATDGGGFVPPQYLGDLYAGLPRAGRPFADVVPSRPLVATGMTLSIPRITTGTATGVQTVENEAVTETELVEATYSVPVRTIAGMQDVSQQLFDRSEPGIDEIIFADLRAAYDANLDTQLLNGTGLNGQHLGIRAVTSPNTVTYTDSSPTAGETVPPIYNAIAKIAGARYQPADTIVMHPRRAAWLASNLSSTFPLFQLGSLTQAAGTQDAGMVQSLGGLRVVLDPNVRTTDGVATNQDEVYVARVADMILWEGEIQARVLPQVLSGTLTVRLQLYAYSAFASGRYPSGITIISGTGLTEPTFA